MQVELIEVMGDDLSVCDAARVSFSKTADNYTPEQNEKLIRYLAKHNHWTPFGHAFASFRIKAPIFVARQLAKHQVGLVWNEESRRYIDSEPEFFSPVSWRSRADNVKQGSGDPIFEVDNRIKLADRFVNHVALQEYKRLLGYGICPEQARMVLPQSTYTNWVWSGSLAAFSRVCKLRLDPHTQEETREIAKMISNPLQSFFPISWKALTEA